MKCNANLIYIKKINICHKRMQGKGPPVVSLKTFPQPCNGAIQVVMYHYALCVYWKSSLQNHLPYPPSHLTNQFHLLPFISYPLKGNHLNCPGS